MSRVIAEQLAECLFVIGDVVFMDEFNEMARRVERERGLGEVWVGGKKAARLAVNVGEVAAASAGDEDFTAGQAAVIEKGYAASTLAGHGCAHQARGSGSQNNYVKFPGWIIHAFEARSEAGIEPRPGSWLLRECGLSLRAVLLRRRGASF